jgi:hypothetical protein
VVPLKRKLLKAQHSRVKLEASRDSLQDFQDFFRGLVALTEMVGDNIFLAMFKLYFFNLSRGIQVDFSTAYHLVSVPHFTDLFPFR